MSLRFVPTACLIILSLATGARASVQFAPLVDTPRSGVLVLPTGPEMRLPPRLGEDTIGTLKEAAAAARFKGNAGESLTLYRSAGYERVIFVGTGDHALDTLALQDLGGRIVAATGHNTLEQASIALDPEVQDVALPAAQLAIGLKLGAYRFEKYKSDGDNENRAPLDTHFIIYSENPGENEQHWQNNGAALTRGVYFARDLISEPGNVIYPESFVDRTREAFKELENVRIEVLDQEDMAELGMGALLGVGAGSAQQPRLLVVEYLGGEADTPPLTFVGKGVTFDSGGISLKRSKGMWRMKYDMSGAAAVTGAVLTLAAREAAVNAVAVAALVENMPSGLAQRPGDIRTSMSGKTIEVLNTDAEGRLILADAVWYAQENYEPALLVDVATLTGSVRTALGSSYAGLFTRDDAVAERMLDAGKRSGEELWRLPLHEDFREAIKSDIADIKNVTGDSGGGGASVGAEVIGSFVKENQVWAHLDIAGKAWQLKPDPTVPKGAAGWGVRLLNQLVMDYYEDRR